MIKGSVLRDSMISGANSIANQRSQIDELNVFPVPDGDTGTNMSMTIGAAKRDLQGLADGCTVDGCHPNDLGFFRMAEAFGAVMERFFDEP